MKRWIQVAGYADDLQAAYDYFLEHGGSMAAARFYDRYERTVTSIVNQPESAAVRGHGWRQKPIPNSTFSTFYGERGLYWMLVGIQSTVRDPVQIQARLLIRETSEFVEE